MPYVQWYVKCRTYTTQVSALIQGALRLARLDASIVRANIHDIDGRDSYLVPLCRAPNQPARQPASPLLSVPYLYIVRGYCTSGST